MAWDQARHPRMARFSRSIAFSLADDDVQAVSSISRVAVDDLGYELNSKSLLEELKELVRKNRQHGLQCLRRLDD